MQLRSIGIVAVLSLLGGCKESAPPSGAAAQQAQPAAATSGQAVRLQGAGASFPAPLYLKWFKAYNARHSDVQVDYQSVGSGSGVKSFIDKTVDFGASDAAMKPEDIARVDAGVQLLPMTAGAIVIAYNLEGVKELKLSRKAYGAIFLGRIRSPPERSKS